MRRNNTNSTIMIVMHIIATLIGITFSSALSLANDYEENSILIDDEKNSILIKEFSRDFTRAAKLRGLKDVNSLARMAEEIQNKWIKKDIKMYGALMVNTLNCWESACKRSDKKAPMDIIRQYATQVLSTYDPNKPDNITIGTEFDLVSILHEQYIYRKGTCTDEEWASTRRKGTERFFHAWQRMEKAIDPNWNPNENVPLMQVPVPGAVNYPGIPPERIKDPVLRAEYEQAIKKNREKRKIHSKQHKLRNIKKMYFRIVKKYLVSTYSIPPYDNEELEEYLNKYIADEKTRAQIVDALTQKIKKQTK